MAENSFDIVAKVDQQELKNVLDMARKEVANRFDFKGAKTKIEHEKDAIMLEAPDKMKMKQLIDVLQSKMAKRSIDLKAVSFGEFESNVTGVQKCCGKIQEGLSGEQIKKITALIKNSKLKVQPRIQGDAIRVSGKSKNDLQEVQNLIRKAPFDFYTDFDNYR